MARKTDQDLPVHKSLKTFMAKPVAEQRKFDDAAAQRFLKFYAQTGRKADSARAAGVSYGCVRGWELEDETFGQLVLDAHAEWLNRLEREAFRRAVEGVEEPVVQGGQIVTHVMKHSDSLLLALMKKADPTGYGNRESQVNVQVNTGVMRSPPAVTEKDTTLVIEDVEE